MKKLLLLLALLACPISAAVAEDLNYMWDIPIGIPLDQAATMFNEATGYQLERKEAIYKSDRKIAAQVEIAGTAFEITFNGSVNLSVDNDVPKFDSIKLLKSCYDGVDFGEDYLNTVEMLQTVDNLHDMLCARFGEPNNAGILAVEQSSASKAFYYIPTTDDGKIDGETIEQMLENYTNLSIIYNWRNIEIDCDLEDDRRSISLFEMAYDASELSPDTQFETYVKKENIITSF